MAEKRINLDRSAICDSYKNWLKLLSRRSLRLRESRGAVDPLVGVFRGQRPLNGRERIRTSVTVARESVFETDAFGHSATLPKDRDSLIKRNIFSQERFSTKFQFLTRKASLFTLMPK
jgi:hypothetical protein